MNDKQILSLIAKTADGRNADDIQIFDLSKISSVADYFVICAGSSVTNVRAICDAIEDKLEDSLDMRVNHIEGYRDGNWVLLDYGNIVVHIFQNETRRFYSIERLLNEAAKVDITEFLDYTAS